MTSETKKQRNFTFCELCNKRISLSNIGKHIGSKACSRNISETTKNKSISPSVDIKCCFCDFTTNKNCALMSHQNACKSNPNRKHHHNAYTKAKEEGRVHKISEETSKKFSSHKRPHTEQSLSRLRSSMKKAVENNPDSYKGLGAGRVKKEICSNGMNVLGKWEVSFVEFCIKNNMPIEQPKIPFPYKDETGYERNYFPDFYLPEYNIYVEVKGYQQIRDQYKWWALVNEHKKNLIILREFEINQIRKNEFVLKI